VWQNDYGTVSMPTDSIQTRVVTFDTTKHFIIPIETLFKRFTFSVHKAQHKQLNYAQLRIATVTRCSWYFAADTTVV